MKRRCWRVPLTISLMLVLFGSGGCEPRNKFVQPPPPEVTVAQPLTAKVAESIDFTGTTEARKSVQIRARITGYLQRITFEDGATVKEGDLLFVIEPAPFEADFEAAQAALQKAEAMEQLAKVNLERALQLQKDRAIAQQEVDADRAEVATATANVKSAQAALRKAKLDLNYTEIRAPISGRIGRHLVDIGNLVNKEQTELAVIENIDPIYAYFNVSEAVLLRFMALVREKKLPDPSVSPPVINLGLQNEAGFPHKGYLDFTDLGVDPTTGTIRRRAVFPNADGQLLPGLFVRLRTEIGDPSPKLLVEERAIGTDQRGEYLLVVNAKNTVEYRPVKLGLQTDSLRVIEQGIQKDSWVVINGLQRARPESVVQPKRSKMAGSIEQVTEEQADVAQGSTESASSESSRESSQAADSQSSTKPPGSPPPTKAAWPESSEPKSGQPAPKSSTAASSADQPAATSTSALPSSEEK